MVWSVGGAGLLRGGGAALAALVGAAMLYFRERRFRGGSGGVLASASVDLATPLADLPVLVVDLETTGLDVRRDRVVSIGAIPGLGAHLDRDGALDMLVNPDQPVPARSTAIHGITSAMAR